VFAKEAISFSNGLEFRGKQNCFISSLIDESKSDLLQKCISLIFALKRNNLNEEQKKIVTLDWII
jgi:hypothetical protein